MKNLWIRLSLSDSSPSLKIFLLTLRVGSVFLVFKRKHQMENPSEMKLFSVSIKQTKNISILSILREFGRGFVLRVGSGPGFFFHSRTRKETDPQPCLKCTKKSDCLKLQHFDVCFWLCVKLCFFLLSYPYFQSSVQLFLLFTLFRFLYACTNKICIFTGSDLFQNTYPDSTETSRSGSATLIFIQKQIVYF